MVDKFWLVWCPSRGAPTKQHFVKAEAIDEARRVAGKEKQKVFVLQCIGAAAPREPPVTWEEVLADDMPGVGNTGPDEHV